MFIDEKEKTDEGSKINGRIKDRLGLSFFSGTITSKKIEFIKHYRENHSDMMVSGLDINYVGILDPRIYHGRRHYQGKYSFTSKRGSECHGLFLLEKYLPSRTLEFFMRMDH